MEDMVCTSLYEKFPWLQRFCSKFSKGYAADQDLLKDLEKELNVIPAVKRKRLKELFVVSRNLFLHFWWRKRWKQAHTWKTYWKNREGSLIEKKDGGCKLMAKLLELVTYIGIRLSKGITNSPWIRSIMQVLRLLPDNDDIVCTSLLSVSVKKKYHSAFIAILKSVLIFNIPQYIKEPVTFIKIMLLFKKLKMLVKNKNEHILLMTSAKNFQEPPHLIPWISSLNLDVSKITKNKVAHQLLKKSCKGLLDHLKLVIKDQENGAERPRSKDNGDCVSLSSNLAEKKEAPPAYFYILDNSASFENQLEKDLQNELCCLNVENNAEHRNSTMISSPMICNINGGVEDHFLNTKSSVYSLHDTSTHKRVCLIMKENQDNHNYDTDSSPFSDSMELENHVPCDKEEIIPKTNKNGRKANLVNRIYVARHQEKEYVPTDPSTESIPLNSNFKMDLFEKNTDNCDIVCESNQRKRKIEDDKTTSIPVSKTSIADDSLSISELMISEDVALLDLNGNGISDISESSNNYEKESQGSSRNALPKVSNVAKCKEVKKIYKFDTRTRNLSRKAPANVKRCKLYNPDVCNHYELSETDSSTVDSTRVAIGQKLQDSNDLSQDDVHSVSLFDCSELGDVFSKSTDTLLDDHSKNVDQLLTETFPVTDDKSIQLPVNSLVEKVSICLDNADCEKQGTNNLNVLVDEMHRDQQLKQIVEKLCHITARSTQSSTNVSCLDRRKLVNKPSIGSSLCNDALSENASMNKIATGENILTPSSTDSSFSSRDGQWCASINQNTLTVNCNISDIGSNDSQININPIDSLLPFKVVINLNTQKSVLSENQCFGNNYQASVSYNSSFNNSIHFHGSYSTPSPHLFVEKRESLAPTVLSREDQEKYEDQPSICESTEFVCNNPHFLKKSSHWADKYYTWDDTFMNTVDTLPERNGNTTCDNYEYNPSREVPQIETNQVEDRKEALNKSVNESVISNSSPLDVEYRYSLRPRYRSSKPVTKESSKPVTKESSKPVTKESSKPVIKESSTTDCTCESDNKPVVEWLIRNFEKAEKSELCVGSVHLKYRRHCMENGVDQIPSQSLRKLIQAVFQGSDIIRVHKRSSYPHRCWEYYRGVKVKPLPEI